MMIEQAEKLMEDSKTKIEYFKEKLNNSETGNLDEKLEISLKENKYLQDTLVGMNDIINRLFK